MGEKAEWSRWALVVSRVTLAVSLLTLALGMVLLIAALVGEAYASAWLVAVRYVAAMLAVLAIAGWCAVACGAVGLLSETRDAASGCAGRLARVEALLEDQSASNRKLIELASLSDKAKSLLFRDAELDAFRETIHEDIMRQDYASAEKLTDAIEERFGYRDEAARLREELAASRKHTLDEKVEAAVARVKQIEESRDWARAFREAHRLLRLFPQNPKIASLPEQVTRARNEHKRSLLEAYDEAVRKNDVDRSINLVKELDRYLTPQEAAALKESARGVFRAKLSNLGVRFAILVTDQQWTQALATGRQIMEEFPNSRMAQEVREKLDLLRAKASQSQAPSAQR